MAERSSIAEGVRLAATTFSVLPLHPARVDRRTAAAAMASAPIVGALLGLVVGAVAVLLGDHSGALLGASVAVVALTLLTRGLHLDGLADTLDGLGCYGDADRSLTVMRSGDVGPFGVAGIVLVLLIDVAALSTVVAHDGAVWQRIGAIAAVIGAGRAAACWGSRRGVPSARDEGLGATVAETLPLAVPVIWTVALAVVAGVLASWGGAVAVLAGALAALGLLRQCVRRFGGMTGDVLGAGVELATAAGLLVLAAV